MTVAPHIPPKPPAMKCTHPGGFGCRLEDVDRFTFEELDEIDWLGIFEDDEDELDGFGSKDILEIES